MTSEVKFKEPRSIDTIKQEYANLIMLAGTLQYEIDCKKKDLELQNQVLRDLNQEYIAAKNKADNAAKQEDTAANAK